MTILPPQNQVILFGREKIAAALNEVESKRYFLVCDSSFQHLDLNIPDPIAIFDSFSPNPLYEDVCNGVKAFNDNRCDAIVAVGGGSTIDVAKCIKLFSKLDSSANYLQQTFTDSKIPLIAVPTTAGTGSESTRYAVIYYDDKKQSVTHDSIVPNYAILDHTFLTTLPIYQKKCTMLDALAHGIESLWSINSTDESMLYGKLAIDMIMDYGDGYLGGDENDAEMIMTAANYAGRAISISQTTAAHAMSYKLTSIYHIPHGHAVALCLPEVWQYILEHPQKCIDTRGTEHLEFILQWLGKLMHCDSAEKGVMMFRAMLFGMELPLLPSKKNEDDLETLTHSVNPIRLKNNPVELDEIEIRRIYEKIIQ